MRRILRPGARPQMALIGPRPPRFIKPVDIGRIDSPRRGAALHEGTLAIRGWTCFSEGRVRRAEVYLGDVRLGAARVGVPRPDVAEVIDYPHAAVSGFELTLPVEVAQRLGGRGSTEVRVVVTSVAGATFEPDPIPIGLLGAASGTVPQRPDVGHIDAPMFRAEISDTLVVQGWACLADGAARRAEVWLGDELLGRARVGVPRPDLAEALDRPEAVLAGYELTVDADEARRLVGAGETEVRVVVTGITGRTFEPAPVPIEILAAAPRGAEEPPAAGVIDFPSAGAEIGDGALSVRGWACFAAARVRRVDVYLGDEALGQARVGVPRPELEGGSRHPQAALGGFELTVSADVARAIAGVGVTEIRAVVRDTGGRIYEPAPVAVRLAPADAIPAAEPMDFEVAVPRLRNGPKTLVVTHQLTLGGAQLFLMDLLNGLTELDAIDPVVVSSVDGPLRGRLEADGIPVHLTNLQPAGKLGSHLGRIEEFLAWAEPMGFDLVLVNTATSAAFAGGEIATRLGIPSAWTIHESFEPALLWADLEAEVRAHAEMVIANASLAIFEADATKSIYERLIDPERCLVLPYGLDLRPIDDARADFDRSAARRAARIPADAQLIVCVGSIEPRKAQVPLAEAFDLIAERHPRARLAFVGGKEGDPNTLALESWIARSSLADRVELIPITPDVGEWYGMADLLVCASDVESLPRTVLEAMAWETPVLATSVFGLPELIDDGETGWLCEPRDTFALATALGRALDAPEATRARIAREARELVASRHSLPRYAERVSELLHRSARSDREAFGRATHSRQGSSPATA
jgi:D-inositol-3-phosphate glycosyltransferase